MLPLNDKKILDKGCTIPYIHDSKGMTLKSSNFLINNSNICPIYHYIDFGHHKSYAILCCCDSILNYIMNHTHTSWDNEKEDNLNSVSPQKDPPYNTRTGTGHQVLSIDQVL